MDKFTKILDSVSDDEVIQMLSAIKERMDVKSREQASKITIGCTVNFGDGKVGTVVLIDQNGVIVTAEGLKKRKTLKWADITSIV